jgi:FKBP-type peptidyl-prolyl cis-trans isomerase (trigger factor)
MKHNIKKLPGSKVELTVNLEDKEFSGYYQSAEDNAAANVTIKGFRKGAAPKEMVTAALDHDNGNAKEPDRGTSTLRLYDFQEPRPRIPNA